MRQLISLRTLMQALSSAASFANEQLSRDSSKAIKNMQAENLPLPPLQTLQISNMKVTFAAFVTEADQTKFKDGGDLQLDFGKPGNFRGEIVFSPFESVINSRPEEASSVIPEPVQAFEGVEQDIGI